MSSALKLIAAACIIFSFLPPAAAGPGDWRFSSSVDYDTGKYGTPYRTSSIYIPFTLKHYSSDAQVSLTVPWLRQTTSGAVTRVSGRPAYASGSRGRPSMASEAGLADIIVRSTYLMKKEGPRSLGLSLGGLLKLPTADEDKGLGTGEMDLGAGLEFSKSVAAGWVLLAEAYYTIMGEPEGADYDSQILLNLGFTRTLRKDLELTAYYQTRSALVPGNADARELAGTLAYSSQREMRYSCGLLLGLSDGSSDLGLSVGASRRF